jgi:deoxyribonuclease IV
VARLRKRVGTIDLVHLNDSKDEAGCGRDRHQNLGAGEIDVDALVAAVREARAPDVVVETPGEAEEQAADIAWIREHLGSALT